ncbi:DSBA oxidoreductase [Pseudomonas aeruginosa]|nr:DSBA oxidoreductase [Pseudomonas aeruginosa]
MAKARLLYVMDPMCSWCWGFAPVAEALARQAAADAVAFHLVAGGLRAGHGAALDPNTRSYILRPLADGAAGHRPAVPLRRRTADGFVYDTEPACRALVAARSLDEACAWPLVKAIQQAFYAEGLDVTRAAVLTDLAEAVGIPRIEFAAAFDSGERTMPPPPTLPGSRTSASPGSRPCWPSATASWRCSPTATSRSPSWRRCSAAGWSGAGMSERGDRLSWAEIRRLALRHKKALLLANLVALLATLCTVPSPCCCRCWWTKCCSARATPRCVSWTACCPPTGRWRSAT